MLKNYIKIAWRNLWKNKAISLINILGLSSGIAFTLLIAGYVWSELQVNKNLEDPGNQYILQSKWKDPNMGLELTTFGPLAKALKEQYPHLVKNFYRFDGVTSNISKGNKAFREGIQIGDSTMLNIYGFKLLHGDKLTALNAPYNVVITANRAIKYFGKTDVIGKTITVESFSGTKHDFTVTGVLANIPQNTVTRLNDANENNFFVSNSSINFFGRNIDIWTNPYVIGFVELQDGIAPSALEKLIKRLITENAGEQTSEMVQTKLEPLDTYHLTANNGLVKKMLFTLSGIALFILLMAVINFINISISKSTTRMKEIGLRKVIGGLKKQLILQFLTESVLLVLFATTFAIVIYLATRSYFSSIIGREIPGLSAYPLYFAIFPFIIIFIIGILSGIYPAFYLSSLKSIDSLKGKLQVKENIVLRKALIGFQFCIAVMVFAGALIITKQVNLFFSRDLGYDKDFVVSAQVPRDWTVKGVQRLEALRSEFSELPQVQSVSLSYEIPNGQNGSPALMYKSSADSTQAIATQALVADEDYAKTYGIHLLAGTFFHPRGYNDSLNVVINETQVKALGWQNEEAIGKQLKVQGSPSTFIIAGVTKDFHFGSMQKAIQPVTFFHVLYAPTYRFLSFKLKSGDIEQSLSALQKRWSVLLPGAPFEYTFMDETLKELYKTELQLKKASYMASVLSLIIVALGMLGLISLSVQKRTKEIGIRKVLGSSVISIVSIFLKEFFAILLVAGTVASFLCYYMMQGWLEDYAYRIPLTSLPFLISVISLAIITSALIIVQTIKAALANPVKSLRTE
ncbi:FtsX-like permease family protein [Pedobacter sp. HMF7647]|uniref:FtsX-like permease family protein n=1 Tax=Hufsiella arboris TaxID=2695275 RepID=A0A7K1YBR4_9SPHI|nr:ABC transporter permease [Hufsiella arboris]MXV51468.1 FtsX-like permease family protein [Hufsiella arboris]